MSSLDRVTCPRCGGVHDLSEMEPSYRRPDAFLAVPADERALRTLDGEDACAVRSADGSERHFFLRVLLPVPVHGEPKPCCWGVWVEVSPASYWRVDEVWNDTEQAKEPPFSGHLANALKTYDGTLGLPGSVQLTGPTGIPMFTLAEDLYHPLALDQRNGAWPERVIEWLMAHHT